MDDLGSIDSIQDIADVGIARWRRERPEIDTSGKQITARILNLAESSMIAMNANLARFGVKYSVYAVIATLRGYGPPYQATPTQLHNDLMITSGGVSNLLRKVEEAGFIQRFTDPADGRGTIVRLTEEGFKLSETTMLAQAEMEGKLTDMFTLEEKVVFAKFLKRMLVMNGIKRTA